MLSACLGEDTGCSAGFSEGGRHPSAANPCCGRTPVCPLQRVKRWANWGCKGHSRDGGTAVCWPDGRGRDSRLPVHACWADDMHQFTPLKLTAAFQMPS